MKSLCKKTYKNENVIYFEKGKEYSIVYPNKEYINDAKSPHVWVMSEDKNKLRFWIFVDTDCRNRRFSTYFEEVKNLEWLIFPQNLIETRKMKLKKIKENFI